MTGGRGGASAPGPSSAPQPATTHGIKRLVPTLCEAPAPGVATPGFEPGATVWLVRDRHDMAGELAELLREQGHLRVEVVSAEEVPETARAVVELRGLELARTTDDAQEVAFGAFRLARHVAASMQARGGTFVTVQDTGGTFGLGDFEVGHATIGGLAGLTKTAALEWERATCRAIDLDASNMTRAQNLHRLAAELLTGGDAREIGLRADGERVTIVCEHRPLQDAPTGFGPDDVIVATGGARGVTAASLLDWAASCKSRFVLLGRSALDVALLERFEGVDPSRVKRKILDDATSAGESITPRELESRARAVASAREIQDTLDAFAAVGAQARYLSVDVRDVGALIDALADVRREWGPVTGLVHGAGVLADRLIAQKTDEQFERVYNTKVAGLHVLLAATLGDPLRLICLFSSVSARFGNVGQADYAVANEALNKLAQAERLRRGDACIVKSINWGPWEGGMVTPALQAKFEAAGVKIIPIDVGARMFTQEIAQDPDTVEVVIAGDAHPDGLARRSTPTPRQHIFEVSTSTHAFLEDHRIQGRAVLPMALVLEWFARSSGATPGEAVELGQLRVLKSGRFDFGPTGTRFIVRHDPDRQALALLDVHDHQLYEATAHTPQPLDRLELPSSLTGRPLDGDPYASPALFHGPTFQVLRDVRLLDGEGMTARLRPATLGQAIEQRTEPLAIDGALQLALLWAEHSARLRTVPMSIERALLLPPAIHRATTLVLRPQSRQANRLRVAIDLLDDDDRLCAALRGVSVVAY